MSETWDDSDDLAYDERDRSGRSVIAGALWRALIAGALTFAAAALYLNLRGPDGTDTALGGGVTEAPTAGAPGTALPVPPPPTAPTLPPSAPTTLPTTAPVVPAGLTVQVLFGAETEAEQYQDAQAVLQGLGYETVEGGQASGSFPATETWFTEGNEQAANDLVTTDARFGTVEDNADRLQAETALHVIVGADWAPAAPAATPAAT